ELDDMIESLVSRPRRALRAVIPLGVSRRPPLDPVLNPVVLIDAGGGRPDWPIDGASREVSHRNVFDGMGARPQGKCDDGIAFRRSCTASVYSIVLAGVSVHVTVGDENPVWERGKVRI